MSQRYLLGERSVFFKFSVRKGFKMTKNFKKITKNAKVWPKLFAHFHIFNQLRKPILKYAEFFVKICLHLAEILMCVTFVTKNVTNTQTDTKTDIAQI